MRYALSETFTGLRRNRSNAIAIVMTLWVSLTLFGIGLISMEQVELMKGQWYDKIEISVFLCTADTTGPKCSGAIPDSQRAAIQAELTEHPQVAEVFYESKAEAFAAFQKAYANSPVLPTVTEEMMQESFRLKLKDPQEYREVVALAASQPGVQAVQDLRAVLEPLFSWLNVAKWATIGASAMLLLAAGVQIMTAIRLTAVQRHRELGIMRLVGASNATIMLPFLLESLIAAVIGSGLAALTLVAGYKMVIIDQTQKILAGTSWISWDQLGLVLALVVAVGVVLSLAPTWMTGRKVLTV